MKAGWKHFILPDWAFPLLLGAVTLLAYGLLFPYLGFYWDEWPMTWIAHRLGPDGLARYFATNRPYWGMIYRITTPLLGAVPWHWQIFGLFWRWAGATTLWAAVRQVWPRKHDAAAFVSLLFLIYPGFGQQSIAMMYGHFLLVLTTYLLSLWLNLLAVRQWNQNRARALLFSFLALLLALVNLLAMEYFFLLELVRPLLIYAALRGESPAAATRRNLLLALAQSAPYLILFLSVGIWRAFFFPYQTQNYHPGLLTQISADPLRGLLGLAGTVLRDLFVVTVGAWGRAFHLPDLNALGGRTSLLYTGVILAALALTMLLVRRITAGEERGRQTWAPAAVLIGLAALLIAGPPFWLTQLPITLDYPNDRFTLPFLLGFSLLFAGLIGLLPGRRVWKVLLLAAAVGFSAGLHFQQASAFRRDWNMQRALFWQMAWRAPGLEPGTTLISSDLPLKYYSDNSLTGPLNWIYAPDNRSRQMSYMFYYASVRSARINLLQTGQPIRQDYLAARFDGTTDQMIALVFHPPACLRILDPELDRVNGMLPELMRDAAARSSTDWIQPESGPTQLDLTPAIFGAEPAHGWCYYFEKADLAAQENDWETVVQLGEQAFALDDYPNDPLERLPFINGYAFTGNWQRAGDLTREAAAITPLARPVLCRLWQRIDGQAPASAEKTQMVQAIQAETCSQ